MSEKKQTKEQYTSRKKHGRRPSNNDTMTGVFLGSSRGFGFVQIEGLEEDVFIPARETNGALHEDTVEIRLVAGKGGKSLEGTVVKVTHRAHTQLVGTFDRNKKFGFVIPDNQKISKDIFVPIEDAMGARNGHKVVVEIDDFGSKNRNPQGRILEIIGHINDPGTDIACIVKAYGIPDQFSKELMRSCAQIPEEVLPEEYSGRKDLRDIPTVTIDGEDAKDLDDAITIERTEMGYRLGVHIADVTHYVREGSLLDKEALKRGTSVYLIDKVIPMLPHRLSNGICSLNAGCDRLALSCIMDIDSKGTVVGHEITESVICVDERMSYTSVKKILQAKDKEECARYEKLLPMFSLMEELAQILRGKRKKRGFVDFDFPETKVILNQKGKPVELRPYDRNVATRMIEEFMLAANETIAEDFFWQESPFLYRTHETPDGEKIARLETLISNFGYYVKAGKESIHPKEFQKLLDKIDNTPEEALISRIVLRTMKQARYTTECTGHFGLATKYYCHFTSPIRRYPDLQIHRIIKETINGKRNDRRDAHYHKCLPEVALLSSTTERRAEEAERECLKLKKAEYMQERIGQIYDGIISGITSHCMYVELPNTVEGVIRLQSLEDDCYYFDEEHYELVGEDTGRVYKLGQPIKVCVDSCDMLTRTVVFQLWDEEDDFDWEALRQGLI